MHFKGVFKERNSRIAEKFYNRGRTYSINGNQNAAISNYKMALNLDQNFAPAHQALGEIFYLKGEMIKSFEHINRAKESKQDEINSHEALKRNHVDENKKKTELKSEFIGEIYFNYEYGFSIKSPHGWRINTKLSPEMLVHFIDSRLDLARRSRPPVGLCVCQRSFRSARRTVARTGSREPCR